MNKTLQDAPETQPGLGFRFWLPWGSGFALATAAFIGILFWLRLHRDVPWHTSAIIFAAVAYALTCAGMSFLPLRAQQKRGLEGPMRPAMRPSAWAA